MRGHQLSEIARHRLGEMVEVNYVNESQLDAQVNCTLILTKGFLKDATLDELGALKEAPELAQLRLMSRRAR